MEGLSRRDYLDRLNEAARRRYEEGAPTEEESGNRERAEYRSSLARGNRIIVFEREIGRSDLLRVNYLERGLRASRAVCHLDVRDGLGNPVANGTGFLVGSHLLMTNAHVLLDMGEATNSLAVFDYEDDALSQPKQRVLFRVRGDLLFVRDEELDFALAAVDILDLGNEWSLADYGHIRLRATSGKALPGERVSIIQHPDGRSKEIAIRANRIVRRSGPYIHYKTDTDRGSSGAPVFSDEWELVALHHAGVKKTKDGQVIKRNGDPFDPETDSDTDILWEANEGIRISSIVQRIRERHLKDLEADHRPILESALDDGDSSSGPYIRIIGNVAEERRNRAWYEVADAEHGYDEDFLGGDARLPLPTVVRSPHDASQELRYRHFSLRMKISRRQALYTACNIDPGVAATHPHDAGWKLDPRLPSEFQLENHFYRDQGGLTNLIDRGHLVKRLDPAWGDIAKDSISDTFHWTNSALQHRDFNQGIWANLEDEIAARVRGRTVLTVFTGPIFADGDPLIRVTDDEGNPDQERVPREFWKVIVFADGDGFAVGAGFRQSQRRLLETTDLDLEADADLLVTYQVPVEEIEDATGLDFHWARDFQAGRDDLEAERRRKRIRRGGDLILWSPRDRRKRTRFSSESPATSAKGYTAQQAPPEKGS